MLVITGIFENERFIPDKPVSIPQRTKVKVIIEENPVETRTKTLAGAEPLFTVAQIEEWAKAPEIQALVGVLKEAGLPADINIKDIRNERIAEKYKI